MARSKTLRVTLHDVLKAAEPLKISTNKVKKLFALLDENLSHKENKDNIATSRTRSNAKPKLDQVMNPNSKYYDDTPHLTKQLSLVWYQHQHSLHRYRHKRITKDDRQWVHLVEIKKELLALDGVTDKNIVKFVWQVFREGERIADRMGKPTLYLSVIIAHLPEIVDRVDAAMSTSVTKRQRKIYRWYLTYRGKVTGRRLKKELEPGTEDHNYIKRVSRLIRLYGLKLNEFLDVHFRAFGFHNSFPRLRDLVSDSAIDRIEQYIAAKKKGEEVPEGVDEDYWRSVQDGNKNKTSRR